jgi:hypothetical protein
LGGNDYCNGGVHDTYVDGHSRDYGNNHVACNDFGNMDVDKDSPRSFEKASPLKIKTGHKKQRFSFYYWFYKLSVYDANLYPRFKPQALINRL